MVDWGRDARPARPGIGRGVRRRELISRWHLGVAVAGRRCGCACSRGRRAPEQRAGDQEKWRRWAERLWRSHLPAAIGGSACGESFADSPCRRHTKCKTGSCIHEIPPESSRRISLQGADGVPATVAEFFASTQMCTGASNSPRTCLCLNRIANSTATTNEYMAKASQISCQCRTRSGPVK